MAEVGIDRSKLPGVKEVCRDFAVREDHTLAHSLQEQEIEHHLATNIQRNRLVKHDLQMAKQLQEEEDRKGRARLQEQHKNLPEGIKGYSLDVQSFPPHNKDIARILQQKELQEEKRRKKPPPDPLRLAASDEGPSLESRDRLSGTPREPGPKDGHPPQMRDPWKGPPLIPEGLDLETWESGSEARRSKDGRRKEREARQEKKKDGHERPPHPRAPPDEEEEEEPRQSPQSPQQEPGQESGPISAGCGCRTTLGRSGYQASEDA
ncbi:putative Coiled-coil domain-containing protein [Naja naja]|nr:putative Coiled-coil domain-containing protein [Naja naja]